MDGSSDGFGPAILALRTSVARATRPHKRASKIDSWCHNYGTGLALAATATATILPVEYSIWARIASGCATFLIAFLRALDFGARWRWHVDMYAEYATLLDRIEAVSVTPPDRRGVALERIYGELVRIRGREKLIPGTGTTFPAIDIPE